MVAESLSALLALLVPLGPPTGDPPVTASLRIDESRLRVGATLELTVDVHLADGWHVYDVKGPSPFANTELELLLPDGLEPIGEWKRPRSAAYPGGEGDVYTGNVSFVHEARVASVPAPGTEVQCTLTYQACNADFCLRPAAEALKTTIGDWAKHRKLRVLYAGSEGGHRERVFAEFLGRWFDQSATLPLDELSMETAADYDVVIVDWMSQYGCDGYPKRENRLFGAPAKLGPDFTKPMIAMTYVGTQVRRGYKLDWR